MKKSLGHAPRRAKSAPRGAKRGQESAKRGPRAAKRPPGAILERFWCDFGPPGTSKKPNKCCTVVKNQGFRDFRPALEKERPKSRKGAPGDANIEPRAAPRGAKSAPRRPQEPPRGGLGAAFLATCDPHGAQEAPRGLREAILTPPGVHFRTLRGTFWEPVSVRFSSPSEAKAKLKRI